MTRQPSSRRHPLTVDSILDAARDLVEQEGLEALSMRKLGKSLGVDPMAVYHHVGSKRELLTLLTARIVGEMPLPSPRDPWDVRVRSWARAYWDVVAANRELVAAGLADPAIAAGGMPLLAPLVDAVAASGIEPRLVEPNAWLVVDFVHGAALGAAAPKRNPADDRRPLLRAFGVGLDTIVAGIAAIAASPPPPRSRRGAARGARRA